MQIPEDLTEFLYWIKERTERFWSKNPETSTDDFVCEKWAYGAKWIGLEESEIDDIEKEYGIQFTEEHRAFLKILHTIDRKEIVEYKDGFDENAVTQYEVCPFFYNWKTDKAFIDELFQHPYDSMLDDVKGVNKVWLKSWGAVRPKSNEEKERIFSSWFQSVPKLIPTYTHRYVVSGEYENGNPVLSIVGSDIVVLGWNMRHYLLIELQDHLDLYELVYDEEDKLWYPEPMPILLDAVILEQTKGKNKVIPILEEMILYWSSGWQNYGKEYPYSKDGSNPIVRTFIAKDEV